jgi:hypothetical protein
MVTGWLFGTTGGKPHDKRWRRHGGIHCIMQDKFKPRWLRGQRWDLEGKQLTNLTNAAWHGIAGGCPYRWYSPGSLPVCDAGQSSCRQRTSRVGGGWPKQGHAPWWKTVPNHGAHSVGKGGTPASHSGSHVSSASNSWGCELCTCADDHPPSPS